MSKFRITPEQAWEFMEKYNRQIFPHERLGQAFVNEFLVDKQDPDLFYEEENYEAYQTIMDNYVDWKEYT